MATIKFTDLLLQRAVLEVKYQDGYRYWDVRGDTVLELRSATKNDLEFKELHGDVECILHSLANPRFEASFGFQRIVLSATNLSDTSMLEQMGPLVVSTVCNKFGITHVDRVGFRQWYIYPTDTPEAARVIVDKLGLFTAEHSRFVGFGDTVTALRPRLTLADGDKHVQILIAPGSRQGAMPANASEEDKLFAPNQCVLIDIDSYIENVTLDSFDLMDFIHGSRKKCKQHISTVLNPGE